MSGPAPERAVVRLDAKHAVELTKLAVIGFAAVATWESLDPDDPRFKDDPPMDMEAIEGWKEARERLRAIVAQVDPTAAALAVEALGDAVEGESPSRTLRALRMAAHLDAEQRRRKGET